MTEFPLKFVTNRGKSISGFSDIFLSISIWYGDRDRDRDGVENDMNINRDFDFNSNFESNFDLISIEIQRSPWF
jgi:hypothetical protein